MKRTLGSLRTLFPVTLDNLEGGNRRHVSAGCVAGKVDPLVALFADPKPQCAASSTVPADHRRRGR